ncbi:RNA polymerase sigma factor [Dyadobacter sp. NIV53]|uniref:RNA polymerase sigma factor n=1 Tax=Dyadobacter sp. NIV53 TaxID=2861765 RepID=UPI001C875DCB|nr:RNA polymerase sigma-70 factor [Dyadobacter sp. NIV53]
MAVYSDHNDTQLLDLMSGDDNQAFAEIYQRYKGVLFVHAYRMLGDYEEAKDVLQELFTSLWTKRNNIVLKSTLSAYLYGATRNRVFDIIAHKKVQEKYVSSLARFLEDGECITDLQVRENELAGLIEKEVALLPPKMRRVFELSRNEHFSYQEIANELHISDKTVKKQVNNALNILRAKLDIVFFILPGLILYKMY